MQAEFAKNVDFALDLVKSAARPDEPKSHLGNTAPDFVPTTFSISTGDPQTVEVNAKRSLGNVKVFWQVNDGRVQRGNLERVRRGRALRQARRLLPQAPRAGQRRSRRATR